MSTGILTSSVTVDSSTCRRRLNRKGNENYTKRQRLKKRRGRSSSSCVKVSKFHGICTTTPPPDVRFGSNAEQTPFKQK